MRRLVVGLQRPPILPNASFPPSSFSPPLSLGRVSPLCVPLCVPLVKKLTVLGENVG